MWEEELELKESEANLSADWWIVENDLVTKAIQLN